MKKMYLLLSFPFLIGCANNLKMQLKEYGFANMSSKSISIICLSKKYDADDHGTKLPISQENYIWGIIIPEIISEMKNLTQFGKINSDQIESGIKTTARNSMDRVFPDMSSNRGFSYRNREYPVSVPDSGQEFNINGPHPDFILFLNNLVLKKYKRFVADNGVQGPPIVAAIMAIQAVKSAAINEYTEIQLDYVIWDNIKNKPVKYGSYTNISRVLPYEAEGESWKLPIYGYVAGIFKDTPFFTGYTIK